MEFRQHQLDNGLTIIAECNPKAYSTSIGFFVSAGSRDEADDIGGVSHFLEHMAFKGTPHRSAADVNRQLDEMGALSNARTGEERTIYHATVLPEFQEDSVRLLADILRPSLREEDFETEKQVIVEEILMYEDQPPFGGHERIMAAFYGDHPLGRSILGTVESVTAMTPQRMRDYFRQRYSPGNILLVATGNVDFEQLVAVGNDCCGQWQPYDAPRTLQTPEPRSGFEVVEKPSASQQYVIQLAAGPQSDSPDRFATRTLATIIGDDSGSRMFWEFVDTGRAEYAGMGVYEYQDSGLMMTVLCGDPESTADNMERLQALQQQVQMDGIRAEELELAKRKIAAQVILSSERPENRLFAVGSNWLQRREYRTVREVADAYRAVTLDEIHQAIKEWPLTQNYSLAIGPLAQMAPIGSQ